MACVLLATQSLVTPTDAAFTATRSTGANQITAHTLGAPSGLSALRPCTPITPTYRDAKTANARVTTSVAVTSPASQSGDVLIAFITTNGVFGNTLTPPSGWTHLNTETKGYYNTTGVFWRMAPAVRPATYTFGWDDNDDAGAVVIVAYSGVDQTTPVATYASTNDSGSSAVAPAVNVARAPAVHLVGFAIEDMTLPIGPPGMTQRATVNTGTDSNGDHNLEMPVYEQTRAATGSTGTKTQSFSGFSSKDYAAFSLVVQRPTTGVDPTVTLSWTATADTAVTGYELIRTGGTAVTTAIAGRATATYTDTTTASATGHTYTLASVLGTNWRSTKPSVTVPSC